jgi:hypothetical protein
MTRQLFVFFLLAGSLPCKPKADDEADRYRGWIETDIASYAGRYQSTIYPIDYDAAYLVNVIAISVKDGKPAASYSSCLNVDGPDACKARPLKKVTIKGASFKASKPKKGTLLHVPKKMKGKFVKKFPPANAKGPVEEGLLLGGEFFMRTPSDG